MVIEHLKRSQSSEDVLIYCFFDYARRNELNADLVFAELLRQLFVADLHKHSSSMVALWNQAEKGRRRPTLTELNAAFDHACKYVQNITLVIDAIDECEHAVRRRLLSSLNLQANQNCRLLIFGRPYVHPVLYFDRQPINCVEVEIRAQPQDLVRFLDNRICDSEDLNWMLHNQGIHSREIIDRVISEAQFR